MELAFKPPNPIAKPKKKLIAVPTSPRVAVYFRTQCFGSLSVVSCHPDEPPIRSNRYDVIVKPFSVCLSESYLHWKHSNQFIDHQVIQPLENFFIDLWIKSLRRIKLYGIRFKLSIVAQANLLKFLSEYTCVEELEIDELGMLPFSVLELSFNSLRLLSIDAIRIETSDGSGTALLRLEAAKLKTFYSSEYLGRTLFSLCLQSEHLRLSDSAERHPNEPLLFRPQTSIR